MSRTPEEMFQASRDLKELTDIIYGEGASTDKDVMAMQGSSVLNRLESNRKKEFGEETIANIGARGYNAVKNNTDLYQQGVTGKFPDKTSETAYKKAMAVASGLLKGTIARHKAQFFFTEKEEMRIRDAGEEGKKEFDFDLVKRGEDSGDYRTYHY